MGESVSTNNNFLALRIPKSGDEQPVRRHWNGNGKAGRNRQKKEL